MTKYCECIAYIRRSEYPFYHSLQLIKWDGDHFNYNGLEFDYLVLHSESAMVPLANSQSVQNAAIKLRLQAMTSKQLQSFNGECIAVSYKFVAFWQFNENQGANYYRIIAMQLLKSSANVLSVQIEREIECVW